jgi:NADPH-dependent glutamate synthase beta subunit-like oxidoreductase
LVAAPTEPGSVYLAVVLRERRTKRCLPAARVTAVLDDGRVPIELTLEELWGDFHQYGANVALHGDGQGWVKEMECVRMELGEPDASGRRRPVEIKGSNFRIPAETVVSALGFGVNPLLATTTPELKTNNRGVLEVGEDKQTSIPGVYAGGDAITGGATVILAMGQGKRAAEAMHEYLMSKPAGELVS